MTTLRCNCNWTSIERGILQVHWERFMPHTQPTYWARSVWRAHIKPSELHTIKSLAATQVGQQSSNSMERKEEPNLSRSHNKGNKRDVPPTRNRGKPRRHPTIAVEQSHHTQEANVQERKPYATNVAKKDSTAVYADPMSRMSKSMRWKHNLQWQHNRRTTFQKSAQQCSSMLMSSPSRLQLSRPWTTQALSHKPDHYSWAKNFHHRSIVWVVKSILEQAAVSCQSTKGGHFLQKTSS